FPMSSGGRPTRSATAATTPWRLKRCWSVSRTIAGGWPGAARAPGAGSAARGAATLTWPMHYFPVTAPALLGLGLLFAIVAGFVAARVLSFASASMGLAPATMMGVLLASLLGSYINIPIAYLPQQPMVARAVVTYFGIPYVVPVMRSAPATVLAINVGGALIPVCMSVYLMVHNQLYSLSLWGIAVVALACHLLATPV